MLIFTLIRYHHVTHKYIFEINKHIIFKFIIYIYIYIYIYI